MVKGKPLVVGTGNIALDHLFLVERPPLFGRYAKVREHLVQGGGSVGNALCVVAQWGYPAAIYGVVGNDPAGEWVRRDFEQRGVNTQGLITLPGRRTREVLIQVHAGTGARQFALFEPPHQAVPDSSTPLPLFPRNAALLHLDTGDAYSLRCAELARQRGMLISYDAGYLRRYSENLLRLCDVVKLSEFVASRLAEKGETMPELLRRLTSLGPRWVVATAGEQGCWAAAKGVEDILYLPPLPPPKVVDTTGAGDAFAGVLMVGLLEDRPLDEILPEAAAAGALNCLHLGARTGIPSRQEVREFLQSHPPSLMVGPDAGAEQDPLRAPPRRRPRDPHRGWV